MTRQIVKTDKAPMPGGAFSQGVIFNNILYTAGQVGQNVNKEMQQESIAAEVRQIMHNLSEVAKAAGTDLSNTLKTTVFITDLSYFKEFNETYAEFFPGDPPGRSTVVISELAVGARVEIEAIIAII
ncbi:MAG: RidA family protein [Candidatus Kariarchaeaceae archaeon]|jgi:2-iminobutanoate/2-iminopropanoate deaminase